MIGFQTFQVRICVSCGEEFATGIFPQSRCDLCSTATPPVAYVGGYPPDCLEEEMPEDPWVIEHDDPSHEDDDD